MCVNIQTIATRFCKSCEEPEPMCEVCASHHSRQKATKDHEICDDMGQFSISKKTLMQVYVSRRGHIIDFVFFLQFQVRLILS